jgi:hypothetical protein
MRPRLLLVPLATELEWVIRPQLEEWADVAIFDAPGVGAEPAAEPLHQQAVIDRALLEVDRLGWDSYIVVCDGTALPTGVRVAHARPSAVQALALGHARLANRPEGPRPTLNREVMEAFARLGQTDYSAFVQYGLAQVTQGSIGEELAARMLQRVPLELGIALWQMNVRDPDSFEQLIRDIDVPLLFGKHEGCLAWTDEGFEDAVAAFPAARTVAVPEAPAVSTEFAAVLRSFCEDVAAATSAAAAGDDLQHG